MKYTNNENLPKSIHTWLTTDDYKKSGDISVTTLLEPPRVRLLTEKHEHQVAQENVIQYKSRRGTAIHDSIERANKDDDDLLQECIFHVDILGWKVKGQFDEYRISTKTLTDFKTVGFYQFDYKQNSTIKKWEKQLNIYNYMIRKNTEYVPEKLQIVAMLPDEPKNSSIYVFNKKNTKMTPGKCIYVVDVKLWSMEDAEMLLMELVGKHQKNEMSFNQGLGVDLCTDQERWMSYNKKTKQKKYLRCEKFCPINQYCDQFNPNAVVLPF